MVIEFDYDWLLVLCLVVIENICNKGGGSIYCLFEIEFICEVCIKYGLVLYLDGVCFFNVLVEIGELLKVWG